MNLFFSIEQWWEAIELEPPWPDRRGAPVVYEPHTMAAMLPGLAARGLSMPEAWLVEHQSRVLWRIIRRGYEERGVDAHRRIARRRGEAPTYVVASPDGRYCRDGREGEAPDGVTGTLWPPPPTP